MADATSFRANILLNLVPAAEIEAIGRDLRLVSFALNETVYEMDSAMGQVYFPITAVLSVLKVMRNGSAVETIAIGREGMAGIRAIMRTDLSADKMIAQIPGNAYGMKIAPFHEHFKRSPAFQAILQDWCLKTFDSLSQSIACNRLHHVNERCAKWLLLTQDRVGAASFPMTQDFLSMMLGVNRTAVSIAASTLQQAGLIRYLRGSVTVQNRQGLEDAACECYATTSKELNGHGGDGSAQSRADRL